MKTIEQYSEVLEVLLTNSSIMSFQMKIRKVISNRLDFFNQINKGSKIRLDLGKEYLISMKNFKTYLEFKDYTLLKYFIQDIIKLQNDL